MVWPPPRIQAPQESGAPADSPGTAEGGGRAEPPAPQTGMSPDWLARPEALIGAVLGGRYRVTSFLGRGPMGIACEGESSRGRHVTLKLLPRPLELPVEHFAWQVRQTLALAHFDHEHVSPINDFGSLDDGSAFVSRARMPGATLRDYLRQGPMPVRRALDLARQIALALSAAHAQDIVHGRLKPENVLIQSRPDAEDGVKVVDFGMAELPVNLRAVAPDAEEARRLFVRTRLYLPAGSGSMATAASDVYSLGVILFEMIAGHPPFSPDAIGSMGAQVPPLSFAECQPPIHVPAAIGDLVMSLLHPDAEQQGVSASHVVQVLDALLGRPSSLVPEPVTSQRPSAPPLAAAEPPLHATPPAPPPAAPTPPAPSVGASGQFIPGDVIPGHAPPVPSAASEASWPPLPQGFSTSSVPPPPNYDPSRPSAPYGIASGTYPPTGTFNPDPATSSGTQPSYPPASASAELEAADTDFRPSFIARLRRLFRSKRGEGF